jgi:hypothetical protein
MTAKRRAISAFAAAWLLLFHYESLRLSYLNPLLGVELPKTKLLFPPAGWIMFYRVDDSDGRAEVYGLKDGAAALIDPHRVFATRWLGYDNIRRNILVSVLHPSRAPDFCRYLARKFPEYDSFAVVEVWIPSVVEKPHREERRVSYRCG